MSVRSLFFVTVIFLLASASICHAQVPAQPPAPAPAAAQPTAPASPPALTTATGKGFQIAVTNAGWNAYGPGVTGLSISFTLQRADGTPVNFVKPDGAVCVKAWSDTDYDGSGDHSSAANYNPGSQTWTASIPGVNPHDKITHLVFDVRDPATTSSQTTTLASDVRFENIALPAKESVTQPGTSTFTSNWGTVVTLKGVTLTPSSDQGQAETRFDFSVDHTKVPDDDVNIRFEKAYDNGVQVDNLYSSYDDGSSSAPTMTTSTSEITPGSYKDLTFEFTLTENSADKVRNVTWTALDADLPIASLPARTDHFDVADESTATFVGVVYKLQHVTDPQWGGNGASYLIWTQSPDPAKVVHIASATWTRSTDGQRNNNYFSGFSDLTSDVWWHTDGTLTAAGEVGKYIRQNTSNNQVFPLTIETVPTTHDQQVVTFSKIPTPLSGQTLIIDQKPDTLTQVPIRLRSISWNAVRSNEYSGQNGAKKTNTVELVFEYTVPDQSIVTLGMLSARDEQGNALDALDDQNDNRFNGRADVDSTDQTISLGVTVPPSSSKVINLRLMLTRDTPTAAPTNISITSDGKWSVVPAATP